jgi:hypothetical protein
MAPQDENQAGPFAVFRYTRGVIQTTQQDQEQFSARNKWQTPWYWRPDFWYNYFFWILSDVYCTDILLRAPKQGLWPTTLPIGFLFALTLATAASDISRNRRIRRLLSGDPERPIEDQAEFLRLARQSFYNIAVSTFVIAMIAIRAAYG